MACEIETYRGFVVLMRLEQAGARLTCSVSFARSDGQEPREVPPAFAGHANKEKASALTLTVAMQTRARAVIDGWLEQQSASSH